MINSDWLNKGTISVISGCMFAGKTDELIRRLSVLKHAKKTILIFKPILDKRYLEKEIVSHDQKTMQAIPVENTKQIVETVKTFQKKQPLHVIAFDEVQFLDKDLFPWINQWANEGKIIICAGLDKDYVNEYDSLMSRLLVRAEKVDKLMAICEVCNNWASHTQRVDKDKNPVNCYKPKILIAGKKNYQARCRNCYKSIKEL